MTKEDREFKKFVIEVTNKEIAQLRKVHRDCVNDCERRIRFLRARIKANSRNKVQVNEDKKRIAELQELKKGNKILIDGLINKQKENLVKVRKIR